MYYWKRVPELTTSVHIGVFYGIFCPIFTHWRKIFTFFPKKDDLIFATIGISIIFASVWINQLIISITNNYGENFETGC